MYIDNLSNLEILGWLFQTSTRESLHLTKYISGKCPGVSIVVTSIVCSRWWQVGAVVLLHHVHVGNNATTVPLQMPDTPRGPRERDMSSRSCGVIFAVANAECISQGLFCGWNANIPRAHWFKMVSKLYKTIGYLHFAAGENLHEKCVGTHTSDHIHY